MFNFWWQWWQWWQVGGWWGLTVFLMGDFFLTPPKKSWRWLAWRRFLLYLCEFLSIFDACTLLLSGFSLYFSNLQKLKKNNGLECEIQQHFGKRNWNLNQKIARNRLLNSFQILPIFFHRKPFFTFFWLCFNNCWLLLFL